MSTDNSFCYLIWYIIVKLLFLLLCYILRWFEKKKKRKQKNKNKKTNKQTKIKITRTGHVNARLFSFPPLVGPTANQLTVFSCQTMSVYVGTTIRTLCTLVAAGELWEKGRCSRGHGSWRRVCDVTASPRPVTQSWLIDYVPLPQTSSSLIQFDT